MIYLDYSAHTPVDPDVIKTYATIAMKYPGNPNSLHSLGRAADTEMGKIRGKIAGYLGIQPEEIIFTSGASESNNLAIKGLTHAYRHGGRHIISTSLEHSSVGGALTALQEEGWEIDMVHIGRDGMIDLEDLRSLLRSDTVLVSICAVDSELGTIQDIGKIGELVNHYPNCHLHVDATQAVGKVKFGIETKEGIDFSNVDTFSFTPHKFYGLLGTGFLYKKKGIILTPQINGGVSTTMYRSGTPDLAGASAMEKALSLTYEHFDERLQKVTAMNRYLRQKLSSVPAIEINSPDHAVPHILNLSVRGMRGDAIQAALDEKGICVSVKSACSVKGTPSKAVYAISHDRRRAMSSFRISLSHMTTEDDLACLLKALRELIH